jgi:hypothetical protein
MEVICFEDQAFYAVIERVVARLKTNDEQHSENKWISPDEALKMLNVTHKATLQRLRDAGKIRFTQPQKKIILYDRDSIIEYLDKHSHNPF